MSTQASSSQWSLRDHWSAEKVDRGNTGEGPVPISVRILIHTDMKFYDFGLLIPKKLIQVTATRGVRATGREMDFSSLKALFFK